MNAWLQCLPLDFFTFLMTTAFRVTAAIVNGKHVFEHENLLFIFSRDANGKVVEAEHFLFAFFFHECLFYFALLFLSDFHHHFLDPSIHFLAILFPCEALARKPRMLSDFLKRDALFGIGVQHLLNKI